MRRACILVAATAALAACGGGSGGTSSHAYHAAATVGDFLTLTIDRTAKTIAYHNITNGDSGTVSYTDRADGGMDVADPNGDLVQCYEMPGVAVVCKGSNLGPSNAREPALLYGILDTPLTIGDLQNVNAGVLQFRTREGGIEVSHVSFDSTSGGSGKGYFPVGQVLPPGWYGKSLYDALSLPASAMSNNSSLGCVEVTPAGDSAPSYLFGTAGGSFMVDSPNGAIFAFPVASSSAFDPTNAGTYTALVYSKTVSYVDGTETGTPTIETATVTIDSSGGITVTSGGHSFSATLTPFAGSTWSGAAGLNDPVHGLFYFLKSDDAVTGFDTPPVFVTFFDHAMVFGEFRPIAVGADGDPKTPAQYGYTYGIAVKSE